MYYEIEICMIICSAVRFRDNMFLLRQMKNKVSLAKKKMFQSCFEKKNLSLKKKLYDNRHKKACLKVRTPT